MLQNNRITKSLCAVMLVLCLLLPGTMDVPAEAAPTDDVYSIDVEFGNLSFYYDYGTWNVNTMRYETDKTSTYASSLTVAGFPGWYGFDDVANKIQIKNGSAEGNDVTMTLSYRPLEEDELLGAGASGVISDVSMSVTGEPVGSASVRSSLPWNDNSVLVPSGQTAVGYIHLSGEPQVKDSAEAYTSATIQAIGMLVLKIESWT